MAEALTSSPAANLLSRTNIVVPLATSTAAGVTADIAAAKVEIAERLGLTTVTGGTITRAKD